MKVVVCSVKKEKQNGTNLPCVQLGTFWLPLEKAGVRQKGCRRGGRVSAPVQVRSGSEETLTIGRYNKQTAGLAAQGSKGVLALLSFGSL